MNLFFKFYFQIKVCKLMFNCINTLIIYLPAVSYNNRKIFKLNDLWRNLYSCIYIAAECLLDMMFVAVPIEVSYFASFFINFINFFWTTNNLNFLFNQKKNQSNQLNKWYDSLSIGKTGGSLKFDKPLDDITSIDLRFLKDFIFRSVQCLAAFERWEKMLSIALKFNTMTR